MLYCYTQAHRGACAYSMESNKGTTPMTMLFVDFNTVLCTNFVIYGLNNILYNYPYKPSAILCCFIICVVKVKLRGYNHPDLAEN